MVVTPATGYPVTRTEAKNHCRVDGTADDGLIDGLIAAATDYVVQYTGRSLGSQTLRQTLDEFADSMELPRGPVQSVSNIKYDDADGVEQTLSEDVYQANLTSDPAWIVRSSDQSWPATLDAVNTVRITYVAGYSTVPASIKQAILLLIGDWYDGRSNTVAGQVSQMPHAVEALLCNYRAFT